MCLVNCLNDSEVVPACDSCVVWKMFCWNRVLCVFVWVYTHSRTWDWRVHLLPKWSGLWATDFTSVIYDRNVSSSLVMLFAVLCLNDSWWSFFFIFKRFIFWTRAECRCANDLCSFLLNWRITVQYQCLPYRHSFLALLFIMPVDFLPQCLMKLGCIMCRLGYFHLCLICLGCWWIQNRLNSRNTSYFQLQNAYVHCGLLVSFQCNLLLPCRLLLYAVTCRVQSSLRGHCQRVCRVTRRSAERQHCCQLWHATIVSHSLCCALPLGAVYTETVHVSAHSCDWPLYFVAISTAGSIDFIFD